MPELLGKQCLTTSSYLDEAATAFVNSHLSLSLIKSHSRAAVTVGAGTVILDNTERTAVVGVVMLTGIALLPGVVVVGTVRLTGTILVTWSGDENQPI